MRIAQPRLYCTFEAFGAVAERQLPHDGQRFLVCGGCRWRVSAKQ